MTERRLFPNSPLAQRDQVFLDRAGNNAFRELDEPAEAIPVEAIPGGAIPDGAIPDGAIPDGTANTERAAAAGYASPHAPGVRRWQSGDFVPTRTAQAKGVLGHSILVFAATGLGWLSYLLVWLGFVEIVWMLFVCTWFGGLLIVAAVACWTAHRDRFLARIGVIAPDEQRRITIALRCAWGAGLFSGLSFAWVLYQLIV